MVIQNGSHDEVVNELTSRRKAQLLQLYGQVNLENDPKQEASKFQWLKEQGVLSQAEMEVKIAQLEAAAMGDKIN